jgi:hypothetical protein
MQEWLKAKLEIFYFAGIGRRMYRCIKCNESQDNLLQKLEMSNCCVSMLWNLKIQYCVCYLRTFATKAQNICDVEKGWGPLHYRASQFAVGS